MWPGHTCAPLRAVSPQSCIPSELHPIRSVCPLPSSSSTPGDWTARVWTDDTAVKTPILTTKYHSTYLTGGTWSPTRPGVFFTTKMDGTLDVWDLFYKHNEPTLTVQVWNECVGYAPCACVWDLFLQAQRADAHLAGVGKWCVGIWGMRDPRTCPHL